MQIQRRHTGNRPPQAELRLSFDARQKSRFRAQLLDGRAVAVMLPRGQSLQDGALLEADDGTVVAVRATDEPVSRVRTHDVLLLSRAAYHLGNRHMPVQILPGELRYHHDHVLDEMLQQLGLQPEFAELPFEPEAGAYGAGHAFSSHPHHGHDAAHSHDHAHDHAFSVASHSAAKGDAAPTGSSPGIVRRGVDSPYRRGAIHTNWSVEDAKDEE